MRTSLIFTLLLLAPQAASTAPIELTCQTRDPASGKIVLTKETVDPARVGVVAVDV